MPAEPEGVVGRHVGAPRVEAIGIRHVRRIAVDGAEHALDNGATIDRHAGEFEVGGGVARGGLHGGLPAQRLLDAALEVGVVRAGARERLGVVEKGPERVGDEPLGGLDAAKQDDERVRADFAVIEEARVRAGESGEEGVVVDRGSGEARGDRGVEGAHRGVGAGAHGGVSFVVGEGVGEGVVPAAERHVEFARETDDACDDLERDGGGVGGAEFDCS